MNNTCKAIFNITALVTLGLFSFTSRGWGESFKMSSCVILDCDDKKGTHFKMDGVDPESGLGVTHDGALMIEKWTFHKDKGNNAVKVSLNSKDKEGDGLVAQHEVEVKNLDGTNSVVHTEVTYLADHPRHASQHFIFRLNTIPPGATCEVIDAGGKVRTYDLAKQEVEGVLAGARSFKIKIGPLMAIIEGGTATRMDVSDSRFADCPVKFIMVTMLSKNNGPFKKGDKQIMDAKVRLQRNG